MNVLINASNEIIEFPILYKMQLKTIQTKLMTKGISAYNICIEYKSSNKNEIYFNNFKKMLKNEFDIINMSENEINSMYTCFIREKCSDVNILDFINSVESTLKDNKDYLLSINPL